MNPAQGPEGVAMRQLESSGDYQALGPVITNRNSMYYGDRAYGAYQVMGRNIPEWTKAALGQALTPAQFAVSQAAQDAVFNHRFGGYIAKYGSAAEAASRWHSGSSLAAAQARGANDGNMDTVDYVNKFMGLTRQAAAGSPVGQPYNTTTPAAITNANVSPYGFPVPQADGNKTPVAFEGAATRNNPNIPYAAFNGDDYLEQKDA